MCKPASFVLTKDNVFWSKKSDSHEEIIAEFKLHADGAQGPNILRVEITPPNGDLSLPIDKWVYRVDQDVLPKWCDNPKEHEARAIAMLKEWSDCKLTGWNVQEAFHPINPFLLKRKRMSEKRMMELLRQLASVWASVWASAGASVWDSVRASVRASVGDSVWASVWASVEASVGASVWDSVGASVWDSVWASTGASVWAYTGNLFANKITSWKYAESLGANPWKPLAELWYAGYVPSFDGKTYRLHAGEPAKVVFKITKAKLMK